MNTMTDRGKLMFSDFVVVTGVFNVIFIPIQPWSLSHWLSSLQRRLTTVDT